MSYAMRAPCRFCGVLDGELRPTNGQNCVYCAGCGKLAYNAPKSETGEPQRSVSTRPDIKPGQRARILMRDLARCVLCGATGNLHVGHVLSVDEGRKQGATDAELFDDKNLACLCEECNLGLGRASFDPLIWLRLLRARIGRDKP
jgi:5-methylcytosine-specific restriction endonuclease McrA